MLVLKQKRERGREKDSNYIIFVLNVDKIVLFVLKLDGEESLLPTPRTPPLLGREAMAPKKSLPPKM